MLRLCLGHWRRGECLLSRAHGTGFLFQSVSQSTSSVTGDWQLVPQTLILSEFFLQRTQPQPLIRDWFAHIMRRDRKWWVDISWPLSLEWVPWIPVTWQFEKWLYCTQKISQSSHHQFNYVVSDVLRYLFGIRKLERRARGRIFRSREVISSC